MFKIDRKLGYALYVLKYFAAHPQGHKASAREIAQLYQAPFDATSRVMQQMAQQGWLHSARGVGGGYSLVVDLSEISFLELSETILGPWDRTKCLKAKLIDCDSVDSCTSVDPGARLSELVAALFAQTPVSELVEASMPLECNTNLVQVEI